MRTRFPAFLLTLGVIGGLVAGFSSLHRRGHHRDDFERHVADVCVGAAARVLDRGAPPRDRSP